MYVCMKVKLVSNLNPPNRQDKICLSTDNSYLACLSIGYGFQSFKLYLDLITKRRSPLYTCFSTETHSFSSITEAAVMNTFL